MDIRLLEKDAKKTKISFLCKSISTNYANSIRRIIINRVPTMAIEDVEIAKNQSALYDEQVAHRLGLIPFKTDLKSYNMKSECKCGGKGCAQCELKMKLVAKGPCTVYSGSIESQDPKVKPAFDNMPIVKLLKGQELEIVGIATLSEAREHTKWSPGLVYYKYKPEIELGKKCDNCGECVKVCPVKVFDIKSNKVTINQDNHLKCHLCNACVENCPKESLKVSYDKETFIFNIESWGQLDCKEMVVTGIERFNNILDQFSKEVKNTLK